MRKYVIEFIGTFGLMLTIGLAVLTKSPLAPLGIGAALTVLVYAGGHISGAHYNPAVTFAVLVRGKMDPRDVLPYLAAQIIGAAAAAGVVAIMVDPAAHPQALTGQDLLAAFTAELVFTYLLCFVVLNTATSASHPNNSFYGIAIGFTVLAGAVAVGGISGAAFNPAVGVGGAMLGLFAWSNLWLYVLSGIIAGVAAGVTFVLLNPTDDAPTWLSPAVKEELTAARF